jgi:hypothetical protein
MLDTDRLPTLAPLVALSREEVNVLAEVGREALREMSLTQGRKAHLRDALLKLDEALRG